MFFSPYNVIAFEACRILLYNTLTGALSLFDDENLEQVHKALECNDPSRIPQGFIATMIEDGFIVENKNDHLDQIRRTVKERLASTDYMLSCMINNACNFGCFYCFQSHSGKTLDQVGVDRYIALADTITRSTSKLEIDWFGGEPLLSFKTLQFLNGAIARLCDERGVTYSGSMTTNGYLLTKEVVQYCKSEQIRHLVITLDGPPEFHNQSRPLKSGEPTFNIILDNIANTVAAEGIKVVVRVNMTRLNHETVPVLLGILEERGLKNRIELSLQKVVSSPVHPCQEVCLTAVEFSTQSMAILKQAALGGWIVYPNINSLRSLGFCAADYPNRFTIDIDGRIFKCGQTFTPDEAVGIIDSQSRMNVDEAKNMKWVSKDPFKFEECRSCNLVPICMGGCSLKRLILKSADYCIDLRHNLNAFLDILVLNEENLARQESIP